MFSTTCSHSVGQFCPKLVQNEFDSVGENQQAHHSITVRPERKLPFASRTQYSRNRFLNGQESWSSQPIKQNCRTHRKIKRPVNGRRALSGGPTPPFERPELLKVKT
jgi:hypothetical protein